jgi:Domain of unknown function (DUF4365)
MQRSNSQKVGSQGQRLVMFQIEDHPHWLVRDLSEDLGIDAEAELTSDGVNGHILKLQFKSSTQVPRKDRHVQFRLERKFFVYAWSCRYPVIFVRIDLSLRQAWYLWLQQWMLAEMANGNRPIPQQDRLVIWVPESQTLAAGLDSDLREIARWHGETQLVLSLLDAMRAAAATYNPVWSESVVALLSQAFPTITEGFTGCHRPRSRSSW